MRVFDRDPKEIAAELQRFKQSAAEYRQLSNKVADEIEKGNTAAAAALFADSIDPLLAGVGMPYQPGEATRPYQKRGAAAATVTVVQVAERILDPQHDPVPVSLSQLSRKGSFLQGADMLASSAEAILRRLGVVANPVYTDARGDVVQLMEVMRPKVAASPVLQRELEPVFSFLEERNEKAAESRDRTRALDERATKKAEERVAAEAREQGRKETFQQIGDLLAGVVKKD